MRVHIEESEKRWVSYTFTIFFFFFTCRILRQDFLLDWSLPNKLRWLVRKYQGSSCLCVPNLRIISMHCLVFFLRHRFWVLNWLSYLPRPQSHFLYAFSPMCFYLNAPVCYTESRMFRQSKSMNERPGVMERGIGSPSVSKACGCEEEKYRITLGRWEGNHAQIRIWGHQGHKKIQKSHVSIDDCTHYV